MTMLRALASGILAIMSVACGSQTSATKDGAKAADLIIVGSIRTLDKARPAAQALAISGDTIVAVGQCSDVASLAGPATTVVRLPGGAEALPGLADAHAHLYGLGNSLESVDLRGQKSEREAAAIIAKAASARPSGDWITGRGWDQNLWSPSEFPTSATLSNIVDHPVAVRRIDGHALWANEAAMKRAGITRDTPDPSGGKIVRAPDGEPSGVFIDTAIDLIENHIPEPDAATRARRIRAAAAKVTSLGLTAVHDMGIGLETAEVYRRLAAAGELDVRVYGLLAYEEGLEDRLPPPSTEPGMFELRAVKMFADGALGSRGAALLAPYSDDPGNSGLVIADQETMTRTGTKLAHSGYQLAVHAIGDRGVRNTLDAFEAAMSTVPDKPLRFRVEHAQVIAPEDIPRFRRLGVIASMQPTHATSDMPWAEARVGPERIRGAYAWRTLLEAGATLAFGSDFPVERPSPLLGLYAAVTRQDEGGQPAAGWYPSERLTMDEALGLFTKAPAFAAFAEERRGVLQPGMTADISVFDGPLTGDASLLERNAILTVVGGRLVFQRAEASIERAVGAVHCASK